MDTNNEYEETKRTQEKEQKEFEEKLIPHYGAINMDLIKKGIDDIADNIQEYIQAEEEWNKGDFEL